MENKVVKIVIGSQRGGEVSSVSSVKAVTGSGLEGDRYFSKHNYCAKQGTVNQEISQITLIESEAIDICNGLLGENLEAEHLRRNIVTRGISLNGLVGKEFMVGTVRLLGIRLCDPCIYLSRRLGCDVMMGLNNIGGLRADILSTGMIRTGMKIIEICKE